MTDIEQVLKDLHTDDTRTAQQVLDLQQQVAALRRAVRYDDTQARFDQTRTEKSMVRSVLALTERLDNLLDRQNPVEQPSLHATLKAERTREVQARLRETELFSHLEQEPTPSCTCGEHHGIRFFSGSGDDKIVAADNVCPRQWWVRQSHLAYTQGRLSEFTTNHPIGPYLEWYKKQEPK